MQRLLSRVGIVKLGALPALALAVALVAAASGLLAAAGGAGDAGQSATGLHMSADAETGGYWSDGSVNLLLTAQLRNDGPDMLRDAHRVAIDCAQGGVPIRNCARHLSFILSDGFSPASQVVSVRAPAGSVDFSIDYGADEPLGLSVVVPKRIVGVERSVWECFRDTSNVGTRLEATQGIGCAAWESEKLAKWDQSAPVKVWATGQPSWTREFRKVMEEIGSVASVDIEWVSRESEADIVARVGTARAAGGESCADGEIGCSERSVSESGEIQRASIRIHSGAVDFGNLSIHERNRTLQAMNREAVRALSPMRERAKPGSAMEGGAVGRVGLSPMDEELLRLFGNPLIEPGSAIADIEALIVFGEDVINPQARDAALFRWSLAYGAYSSMLEGETARFRIRSDSPDCNTSFDWADYHAANITRKLDRFSWVKLTRADVVDLSIESRPQVFEYWHRPFGKWWPIEWEEYIIDKEGWRGDLADPHRLLETLLRSADWDDTTLQSSGEGGLRLKFDMDMKGTVADSFLQRLKGHVDIDPNAGVMRGFDVRWTFTGQACNTHHFEAESGSVGDEFEIPSAVLKGSTALEKCDTDLGVIDGSLRHADSWLRHCAPTASAGAPDEYSRTFDFTLGDWLIARLETDVKSGAATRLRLSAVSEGETVPAAQGAGARLSKRLDAEPLGAGRVPPRSRDRQKPYSRAFRAVDHIVPKRACRRSCSARSAWAVATRARCSKAARRRAGEAAGMGRRCRRWVTGSGRSAAETATRAG